MSVFTINKYRGSIGLIALLLMAQGAAPLTGEQERFVLTREQRDSMSRETIMALRDIQNFHYTKRSISEIDNKELIASFMKELDYNSLFFLRSDHDELFLRFGATLKRVYLGRGDLYPAFQMFKLYRERAMHRFDWVFEKLQDDFDFSVDETFTPDRSEMPWPIDQAEADTLWEKRLKFDLLQEILSDQTLDQARKKIERRYRRSLKYIDEIEPHDIQELFITALANMYDPHSTFLSSDTMENFNITMRKSLVGIGALLRDEDGYCVIQELLAGGPAEQSGQLYPGDRIIEVAQAGKTPVDVIDMRLSKIVKLIRGKKGTEVRLTVLPAAAPDPSERKLITLQRDEIKLTENLASAEIHDVPWGESRTVAVGVIELSSFYGPGSGKKESLSTTRDVEELILKLNDMNIQGLILDLRRNGGGFLNEAVTLTGLFISKGPVVQVKDMTGRVRKDWDRDPKIVYDGPLIVLVSRRSASASEIVAGALQNHRRALIVGDTATHGKGTVQAVFELDRGQIFNPFAKQSKFGATKITIQKFYLPNGDSTQKEGVRSDIVIPSINDHLPIGESDLPNALIWDSIDPLKWEFPDIFKKNGSLIEDELIELLRNESMHRQDTLEEFSYLKRNIDWFKERQERKEVPLNFETRKHQKEEDTMFREEMETIRNELLRMEGFPSRNVLLELSIEKEAEHQSKLKESLLPNGKPRANNYYQKVFYYQPEGTVEIQEIWVEQFDYEKAFKQSEVVARFLSEKSGRRLDTESVENLFNHLKNADPGPGFQMEKVFQDFLGEYLDEERINALLPHFFTKLIEINPDVLRKRSGLDIALRESLRILADWVQYNDNSTESAALVSPQQKKG